MGAAEDHKKNDDTESNEVLRTSSNQRPGQAVFVRVLLLIKLCCVVSIYAPY